LVTITIDRFGMAEGLIEAGCEMTFGDLIFCLNIPIPMHSFKTINRIARIILPIFVHVPIKYLYPTGEKQEKVISKYEMNNQVHEKGYRNKPLTDEQKASNKKKSKTRARVEHVFGFMEQSMNGLIVKSVGITRATSIIGLINLTYNLFRYEQVIRLNII